MRHRWRAWERFTPTMPTKWQHFLFNCLFSSRSWCGIPRRHISSCIANGKTVHDFHGSIAETCGKRVFATMRHVVCIVAAHDTTDRQRSNWKNASCRCDNHSRCCRCRCWHGRSCVLGRRLVVGMCPLMMLYICVTTSRISQSSSLKWTAKKELKLTPSDFLPEPQGLNFNSPQPDTSWSCKFTDTGLVCHVECLFSSQLVLVPIYTAWWLNRGTCVWTTCRGSYMMGLKPVTIGYKSNALTTTPPVTTAHKLTKHTQFTNPVSSLYHSFHVPSQYSEPHQSCSQNYYLYANYSIKN